MRLHTRGKEPDQTTHPSSRFLEKIQITSPGQTEIKLVLDHHEITAKTKNLKVQLKDTWTYLQSESIYHYEPK